MNYRLLNEVLIEWNESSKKDSDNVLLKSEDIKEFLNKKYFVYKINNKDQIKIFCIYWPEFKKYKDKIWINDKHVELDEYGWTVDWFEPGKYKVYVEDIDKVTNMTYMFYNCEQLISVFIPNSITFIGTAAFSGCGGLTSVTIPNSVTEISKSAFRSCSSLTSVTIPNSVTTIGQCAFNDCINIEAVYVEDINKFNQINFKDRYSDPTRYKNAKLIELKK